jgi:hypothetical protein
VRLVAVILGPAQVHAAEHLRPIGGVDAAGARANRDDRAVRVVRPVEVGRHLELVEPLGSARNHRIGLGLSTFLVAEHLDDLGGVAQRRIDGIDRIEIGAQVGDPLHHLPSVVGIAPEIVSVRACFELGYAATLARVVKGAP